MKISSTIFNDAINVSDKVVQLADEANERRDDDLLDRTLDYEDQYQPIITKLGYNDYKDDKDFKRDVHKAMADEDKSDAVSDVLDSYGEGNLAQFADSGSQLWFIPRDSTLYEALEKYYRHLGMPMHKGISDYIDDSDIDDLPDGDGFYMTTGSGYDIHDSFFAGVKVPKDELHHNARGGVVDGVGSGIPTHRFLKYINSVR